jgi:hypothetical protein
MTLRNEVTVVVCHSQSKEKISLYQFLRSLHSDMSDEEFSKMQVTMYQTYFDESGIDKPDVCVVAGFLGGISAHTVLANKWKVIMRAYKVPVFHAIQFYAPAEKIRLSTTNPFRGWSKLKRDMFVSDIMKAIEEANIFPIGCGVDSVAFQNRTLEERHGLTGGVFDSMRRKWSYQGKPSAPYFLALRGAIECAGFRVTEAEEPNALVSFIMSEQNEYERGAMLMYSHLLKMQPPLPIRDALVEPMIFEPPANRAQLQAADFVAYHLYRYVKERRVNRNAIGSPILRRLVRLAASQHDLKFVTAEALETLCSRFQHRRNEAEQIRQLKLSRLRCKVSHKREECTITGRVDAGGNFLPQDRSI